MTAAGAEINPAALLAERVIEPKDFVADTKAFVDVRIPRSKGKASYSFIGPGVSQNAGQDINLTVEHGFQIGAASMPHGVVNNPHLHFTAEVFICTNGRFRFDVGAEAEQALEIEAGTVFSAPTWVFRGFENTGPDDGWLFVVLGGDDTGGILWAPSVLAEAAETGLHLTRAHTVIDEANGDEVVDVLPPLTEAQLASVDRYTDAELAECVVPDDGLHWSDRGLLSSVAGHRTRLAPVIGNGLTEDRSQRSPITSPHGFSIEWLEVEPGSSVGRHRLDDSQVLLLTDGDWQVELATAADRATATPSTGSVVSIPTGVWRDFANVGTTPARAAVVCGGDGPTTIDWAPAVVDAAADAGWTIDAAGYLAPLDLIEGARPKLSSDRPVGETNLTSQDNQEERFNQ